MHHSAHRGIGRDNVILKVSDKVIGLAEIYSLSRMRSELMRLVQTKADKIKAPTERYSFLSSIYEIIMHELVSGPGSTIHPRIQSELSFFRTREEEARRRSSV